MEFQLDLDNEEATRLFARDLSLQCKADDLIALNGDLGAGKSTFARHFVRSVANNDGLDVPSPTFTLMQIYEAKRFTVVHADLYRLKSPDELQELGWDEASQGAVVLVEWAERLGGELSGSYLDLRFASRPLKGANYRHVTIKAHGEWVARIERLFKLRQFIKQCGLSDYKREFMQGDASSRTYERLIGKDNTLILMNSPTKPDGAPIRNGLPYSKIAHLAENMVPFVALSEGLRSCGFSAPLIEAADLHDGFLVLEDLGHEGIVDNQPAQPVLARYKKAIEVLAELHSRPRANSFQTPLGVYHLPHYDVEAMKIELELLLDWFIPMKGGVVPASEKWAFIEQWLPLLHEMAALKDTWVLRDYHSPNLLWLPSRDGLEQIGIIDFQDAMIGPCAYDVVSLTQDARVSISPEIEQHLLAYYVSLRETQNSGFERVAFAKSYAIMGAQRATKILGIFARLNKRDGKPQYLKHIPRIYDYLQRNLRHDALKGVARWCAARLPK